MLRKIARAVVGILVASQVALVAATAAGLINAHLSVMIPNLIITVGAFAVTWIATTKY